MKLEDFELGGTALSFSDIKKGKVLSTSWTPNLAYAWDDGVVLQVPLYAYALSRILDNVEVARVEYRALSGTKPGAKPGDAYPHCLQLLLVNPKTRVLKLNDEDITARVSDGVEFTELDTRKGVGIND